MDAAVEVVQSALNDVHQSYCLLSCTQGRQFWLLSSEGRRVSPLTSAPLIAEKDNRPLPLTQELFSPTFVLVWTVGRCWSDQRDGTKKGKTEEKQNDDSVGDHDV